MIAQEAKKKHAVVNFAEKKGKSYAAQKYGVSLSREKRWYSSFGAMKNIHLKIHWVKEFPFKIKTIQTDNGIEFTYKYISDETPCPFDIAFEKQVLSTNSFHLVHRGTMVRLKEATAMNSNIFTIGKSSAV
jgi:hypothetical protein